MTKNEKDHSNLAANNRHIDFVSILLHVYATWSAVFHISMFHIMDYSQPSSISVTSNLLFVRLYVQYYTFIIECKYARKHWY